MLITALLKLGTCLQLGLIHLPQPPTNLVLPSHFPGLSTPICVEFLRNQCCNHKLNHARLVNATDKELFGQVEF
ncbi:hypothetical protein H4Q26_017784 [Puccinia striiformis f. sp. tritici PST-130]|uniref:Secreted protein n=1 Tax=Puccinia striiformis f. sp. tritici PST-78 TaxID=1165861 RepID=A0A0L0VK07_9BASI|nr:hypothetical protein H4Q26_017784 [Puccinia striiformis f. sp. tritici PST-130]KNE99610.1 hypothetical protein PSTG_07103 [Puccinia striiformis f. sp. tritici PST-78]